MGTLASDAFAGRGTLEEGERIAADYLAAELAALGLRPLPGREDYQVSAELVRTGFDPKTTRIRLRLDDAVHLLGGGIDVAPFGFSKAGKVEADVVFAGYGISRPDLEYDDYEGLDVAGKVVFVLRHAPKRDENDKRFDGARDAFFASKAALAQKKGAVGMILVTDPKSLLDRDGQAGLGGDDLRMTGRLQLPPEPGKEERADEGHARAPGDEKEPIVAMQVSAKIGESLARQLGAPLAAIQGALDSGERRTADIRFLAPAHAVLEVGQPLAEDRVSARNVVAFLPGSDPRLADEWVVVGAHFDHLGRFDGPGDTVYNGADDNASGTSAMLAVARRLAQGPRPRRSVVFVGFSAEEKGLLGSRSLVRGPLGNEHVVFMLNMDMLGRNGTDKVSVEGDGYARGLDGLIAAANADLGLELELAGKMVSGNSDHYPFFAAGIPVMNLFTGLHDDYHQLSDHADKLDYPRMAKIATLAERVARRVADADERLSFIHRPFWFGAAIEVEGEGRGARPRVIELEPDAPAQRAGLAVGDVIVGVGGSGDGFAAAKVSEIFAAVEPGTDTVVTIERDGVVLGKEVHRARSGYLGVFPRGVDETEQKKYGLAADQGVLIAGLADDGPAGKAGIEKDDILIEIAGKPVGLMSLGMHLARIGAGEKVPVLLIRGGQRIALTMVLGERPEP